MREWSKEWARRGLARKSGAGAPHSTYCLERRLICAHAGAELFGAEGDDGVDGGGAAGWDEAGQQGGGA